MPLMVAMMLSFSCSLVLIWRLGIYALFGILFGSIIVQIVSSIRFSSDLQISFRCPTIKIFSIYKITALLSSTALLLLAITFNVNPTMDGRNCIRYLFDPYLTAVICVVFEVIYTANLIVAVWLSEIAAREHNLSIGKELNTKGNNGFLLWQGRGLIVCCLNNKVGVDETSTNDNNNITVSHSRELTEAVGA